MTLCMAYVSSAQCQWRALAHVVALAWHLGGNLIKLKALWKCSYSTFNFKHSLHNVHGKHEASNHQPTGGVNRDLIGNINLT